VKRPKISHSLSIYLHSGVKQYLCEAKFEWDGFTLNKVEIALARACKDASDAKSNVSDEIPCGIAFVSLSLPRSKSSSKVDESIVEVVQVAHRIFEESDAGVFAWSFPVERRSLHGDSNDYNPGIIMFAQPVKDRPVNMT
jgi:hypothetical protein